MNKIETKLVDLIKKAVKDVYGLEDIDALVMIEIPRDNSNGDYSTNGTLTLPK